MNSGRRVTRSPVLANKLKAVPTPGCGGFVEAPERTEIQFEVSDMPKLLYVCDLCGHELVIKRLLGWCDSRWTKEVPALAPCGSPICLSDESPEQLISTPGHYRVELKDCPGEPFPEEFLHDLVGISFEHAKCWYAARALV